MSREAAIPHGRVVTIPPGLPFADTLAGYLLKQTGGDPLALAAITVLLPTRRSCRAVVEAFLRLSGGRPLLLPRLRPLDAVDEDETSLLSPQDLDLPAAIPPMERHLLLTRLVMEMMSRRAGPAAPPPLPHQAAHLAAELAKLLDDTQVEEVDMAGLNTLAPQDYAAHWQETLDFLKIVTESWPVLRGAALDPQERTTRALNAQADLWRQSPPDGLVVAAGSTGARPATARLMDAIARLPQGLVVLPGLNTAMDPESWAALDDGHPQSGMKRLLDRLGLDWRKVPSLTPAPDPRAARSLLLAEAMRPAATCDAWRALPRLPAATDGVTRIDAPTLREEAGVIALILRQALETPGRTAALVTPDRGLATRVAAELDRWGLGIDDSAGQPLSLCEAGVFLRLLVQMVADDFSPHATLACLKHPLAAGGDHPAQFRAMTRRLELLSLRGPRPAPGLAGLKAACRTPASDRLGLRPDEKLLGWLDNLAVLLEPLAALMARDSAPLDSIIRTHMECAEALATDNRLPGAARLWAGEAGESLAAFAAELTQAAQATQGLFPPIPPRHYPALLDEMMAGRAWRRRWGGHPRLFLWGPMEARLQQADVMIMGGLNEGTWPGEAQADPWMSRPMRQAFGLAPPERHVGLSAHDFTQCFAAPQVVLTRSARVDGTPTQPSRWLMRLDAVMDAAGLLLDDGRQWLGWLAGLDRPQRTAPLPPPAPRPPVEARPRQLSVTAIETWMRDPYAIYAKHILGLAALDPIDADPGASDYGQLVHRAMELFTKTFPGPLPDNALDHLLALGRQVFAPALTRPGIGAFWWPRFTAVARWLVDHERDRRHLVAAIHSEIRGDMTIQAPGGPFLVHARADRIDHLVDGSLAIIDYKTGAPASAREVAAGYAPQLPLEGMIAQSGGFTGIDAAPVSQLLFWRLKGGPEGGEEKSAGPDAGDLCRQALAGLAGLVAAFDDPNTPYEARPHPDNAPTYSDYGHLARLREWADGSGETQE